MIKTREEAIESLAKLNKQPVENRGCQNTYEILEFLLHEKEEEKQKEKTPQPKQWPKVGDGVWILDGLGRISERIWDERDTVLGELYLQGNVFRTYEQAEAERDLRMHIAKFPMPEISSKFLMIDRETVYTFNEYAGFGASPSDLNNFRGGIIISMNITLSDQDERIRLLKKWAEAFSS